MRSRRVAGAALWGLFAALVVGGGWLFLRACALDALGLDYCPVRGDGGADAGAMRRAAAEGDGLAREVHMAELSAAEAPVCAPPAPAPVVPAASPALIPPTPPPVVPAPARPMPQPAPAPRAEPARIDRKVEERGGRNGRLQFTLEWATLDDLDLDVDCPGGDIDSTPGHAGPGICGDGRKDVDANRNLIDNVSSTPIENVVWQDDVPSGLYRIEVIEYKAKASGGNTVPFNLRLRWNGQERECHDVVTVLPASTSLTKNGKVLGGTEKLLTWTFGTPLPDCTFVTSDTIRGGPQK